jgi:hypothetical protein
MDQYTVADRYITDKLEYEKLLLVGDIMRVKYPNVRQPTINHPDIPNLDWDDLSPDVRLSCKGGEAIDSLDSVAICYRDGEFVCVEMDKLTEEEVERVKNAEFKRPTPKSPMNQED